MFSSPGLAHAHDSLDAGSIIITFTDTCWDVETRWKKEQPLVVLAELGASLFIVNSEPPPRPPPPTSSRLLALERSMSEERACTPETVSYRN